MRQGRAQPVSRADLTAATPFTKLLDQVVGLIEHAEFLDKVSAPVAAAASRISLLRMCLSSPSD